MGKIASSIAAAAKVMAAHDQPSPRATPTIGLPEFPPQVPLLQHSSKSTDHHPNPDTLLHDLPETRAEDPLGSPQSSPVTVAVVHLIRHPIDVAINLYGNGMDNHAKMVKYLLASNFTKSKLEEKLAVTQRDSRAVLQEDLFEIKKHVSGWFNRQTPDGVLTMVTVKQEALADQSVKLQMYTALCLQHMYSFPQSGTQHNNMLPRHAMLSKMPDGDVDALMQMYRQAAIEYDSLPAFHIHTPS
jgi:hypothetical protein